jgi:hypothetical protein
MTYAYVTTETCRLRDAVRPGALIGRDEIPVSRDGDYTPWPHGKRETLRRMTDSDTAYERQSARAVAELLGWSHMTVTRNFLAWAKGVEPDLCLAVGERWDDEDVWYPLPGGTYAGYDMSAEANEAMQHARACWEQYHAGDRAAAAASLRAAWVLSV